MSSMCENNELHRSALSPVSQTAETLERQVKYCIFVAKKYGTHHILAFSFLSTLQPSEQNDDVRGPRSTRFRRRRGGGPLAEGCRAESTHGPGVRFRCRIRATCHREVRKCILCGVKWLCSLPWCHFSRSFCIEKVQSTFG